jgi:hypothetical protein
MKPALPLLVILSTVVSLHAADQPSLYERVAARLADRPDLATLGQPPAELEQVAWMHGSWTIEATVFATPSSPERTDHGSVLVSRVVGGCWLQLAYSYPTGTQDLGFMTYNRVTRRWTSVGLDSTGNAAVVTAAAWEGNRLVFETPALEIVGERVHIRQTIEKLSPDEFVLRNEERLPDGTWRALDQYRYRRQP